MFITVLAVHPEAIIQGRLRPQLLNGKLQHAHFTQKEGFDGRAKLSDSRANAQP